MTTWNLETTDTFGGEANYCWCDRQTLELPDNLTERQLVCALRKAAGLNGTNAKTETMGDGYRWSHPGACIVTFASPDC